MLRGVYLTNRALICQQFANFCAKLPGLIIRQILVADVYEFLLEPLDEANSLR